MRVIDISMELDKGMLIYPNNMHPEIKMSKSLKKDRANQSFICIESHTGTHADAGYHAIQNGWKLCKKQIKDFLGEAVVIDVTKAGRVINKEHLKAHKIKRNDIVLLKTENSMHGYKKFRKDYASLGLSGAMYLKSLHVKAVGIDYLSIEKYMSDMSVHKALLSSGIIIYEGLLLGKVKAGRYRFIGMPVKYDGDAAPVRAVLLTNE